MHSRPRTMVLLILILLLCQLTWAQEATYVLRQELFKEAPSSIKFSPDGSQLLTGFSDGSIRILNPESFLASLELNSVHIKAVNAVGMTPDMDLILSAGHKNIRLWDRSGNKVHMWVNHATTIWNMEISRDGKWAVSSAFNKTFLLWDIQNRTLAEKMRGHDDVCLAISISPDMQWIASGSKDKTIKLWDLNTREVKATLNGPPELIYDLDFSPDSRLLAAASQDETIRIYDVDSTNLLHILKGHRENVMEVEFSPDGRYLVSGSTDHSMILWDVRSGESIYQYLEQGAGITDLAFHPDGKSFYSISSDGQLIRWALHPEVFVLKYYEEAYLKDLSSEAAFEARRKGESKKDYQSRLLQAAPIKERLVDHYYQLYLKERDLMPKNIP